MSEGAGAQAPDVLPVIRSAGPGPEHPERVLVQHLPGWRWTLLSEGSQFSVPNLRVVFISPQVKILLQPCQCLIRQPLWEAASGPQQHARDNSSRSNREISSQAVQNNSSNALHASCRAAHVSLAPTKLTNPMPVALCCAVRAEPGVGHHHHLHQGLEGESPLGYGEASVLCGTGRRGPAAVCQLQPAQRHRARGPWGPQPLGAGGTGEWQGLSTVAVQFNLQGSVGSVRSVTSLVFTRLVSAPRCLPCWAVCSRPPRLPWGPAAVAPLPACLGRLRSAPLACLVGPFAVGPLACL